MVARAEPGHSPVVVAAADLSVGIWTTQGYSTPHMHSPEHMCPDIQHPATKGHMLEMLRGIYRTAFVSDTAAGWHVFSGMVGHAVCSDGYPTEGEALAAALLSAWGER